MHQRSKKYQQDNSNLLEILAILAIMGVIFPVCWIGEKIGIGPERNELGNFLVGLLVIGAILLAISMAFFGLWIFF